MGFCSRTTTQSWLFFLRVVVKTASAFLLASTLVFTFELPLFAEDGPSCVLNGVEKEIKEEKIRLSVQFKSGIETLKTLGARDAGLSGSGSAVFGRFLAEDLAVAAKDYLVERLSCRAWSAKTLDASAIPERMSV